MVVLTGNKCINTQGLVGCSSWHLHDVLKAQSYFAFLPVTSTYFGIKTVTHVLWGPFNHNYGYVLNPCSELHWNQMLINYMNICLCHANNGKKNSINMFVVTNTFSCKHIFRVLSILVLYYYETRWDLNFKTTLKHVRGIATRGSLQFCSVVTDTADKIWKKLSSFHPFINKPNHPTDLVLQSTSCSEQTNIIFK